MLHIGSLSKIVKLKFILARLKPEFLEAGSTQAPTKWSRRATCMGAFNPGIIGH